MAVTQSIVHVFFVIINVKHIILSQVISVALFPTASTVSHGCTEIKLSRSFSFDIRRLTNVEFPNYGKVSTDPRSLSELLFSFTHPQLLNMNTDAE